MAGLLYFIDGKDRSIKLDEIHKLGLDYAFDKQPTPSGVSGRGPSGSAGVVLADPKRVPTDKIGYYLDKQTWLQMPGKPVWVGFYTDDRPKPEDLQREHPLPGYRVKLADGQEWVVPVALTPADSDGFQLQHVLPTIAVLSEEGELESGSVEAKYAPLLKVAMEWFRAVLRRDFAADPKQVADFPEFSSKTVFRNAMTVLAQNYRTGPVEIASLKLFNEECASNVLDCLIDKPSIIEFLEKKRDAVASGSPSVNAGPEASCQTTVQA
ncbi:MAG: hypothetical protein MI923_20400 [Phycisphaerales bacterium]|nr:hypothetical protein [Phycisphaerales bacterium]